MSYNFRKRRFLPIEEEYASLVMVLGNRIQEVMWQKRITQEDLARVTGIKQAYLSEIINDQRDVRISTAKKIAKALGKSLDYLWPD